MPEIKSDGLDNLQGGRPDLGVTADGHLDDLQGGRPITQLSIPMGSVCWGHITGVTQDNIRTFALNWTGTGSVENTGDAERLVLQAGQYIESEPVQISGTVEVLINPYDEDESSIFILLQ